MTNDKNYTNQKDKNEKWQKLQMTKSRNHENDKWQTWQIIKLINN